MGEAAPAETGIENPQAPPAPGFCALALEVVLLAMACLAPWAFGAVEAWAELALDLALAVALGFALALSSRVDRVRNLLCVPSLAVGALVLLGLFQAAALPEGLLKAISPASAADRAAFLPKAPERVRGVDGPAIGLPPATISESADATVQITARLAGAWLLLQAVLCLGSARAPYRRFAAAIAVNATLLALFGLVQALSWNGKIYWVRPSPRSDPWAVGGPFISHSHLAEYLNIGLGLAVAFLLSRASGSRREGTRDGDYSSERSGLLRFLARESPGSFRGGGRRGSLWAAYGAAVMVLGIVTMHSRGGFLAMLIAAALMMILLRAWSPRLWLGLGAIVLASAAFLLAVGKSASYQERLGTIFNRADRGYSDRLDLWSAALQAWKRRPVLGTGLGSFPVATQPYLLKARVTYFARAENEYVDLLCEGGAVGLALGLTALGGIVVLGRRAYRATPPGRDRALLAGAMFGGITLALHSNSDFGLHVPGVAVTVVLLAGHVCRLGLAVPRGFVLPPEPEETGRRGHRRGQGSRHRHRHEYEGERRERHGHRHRHEHRSGHEPDARGGRSFAPEPDALSTSASEAELLALAEAAGPPSQAPQTGPPGTLAVSGAPAVGPLRPAAQGVRRIASWALGIALLAISLVLVAHARTEAELERLMRDARLPVPDQARSNLSDATAPRARLDEAKRALEAALRLRPSWAEGQIRLGLTHLALYRQMTDEWLREEVPDPAERAKRTDPLWLLSALHASSGGQPSAMVGELLEQEPVREGLLPAAVAFLAARRACPATPAPHAELAALHYLLEGGDPPATYLERALGQAGGEQTELVFCARVAVAIGDGRLAAQAIHRALLAVNEHWQDLAYAAASVLTPRMILEQAVPNGRYALWFADLLYNRPEDREWRRRFLESALDRLRSETDLPEQERLALEAEALAGLGRLDEAKKRMLASLALDPKQPERRGRLVAWLIALGDPDEAHKQAVVGLYYTPDDKRAQKTMEQAADALARGPNGRPAPEPSPGAPPARGGR